MHRDDVNTTDSTRGASPGSGGLEHNLINAAWAQFERISGGTTPGEHSLPATLSIPGYRILDEIHRGGQGVVYQAIQESTRRKIAIKVLKHGPFADRIELARFEREVDVLSRLNHPHIVAIHDRGMSDGHAYYVMDYIAGQGLDAFVAGQELSVRQILEVFAKVCEAVNVAHLRGVIHRDLKPGNIRIDLEGEPRILDFGLAKLEHEVFGGSSAQGMTLTGQFIGSLPWASPEQADGHIDLLDIRTDVYSLGVILYQLLTARFPYPVTGRVNDVVRHITQTSPARPSSVHNAVDHELETIVLKCLAKEAEQRYQSAGDLARDIRLYLANEPILATPPSTTYRIRKFVQRNKGLVFAVGAITATFFIAAGVSIAFGISEARQRKATQKALIRAEHAERETKSRADELEKVANFQQAQLAGIDARMMGVHIRDDLLIKARSAAENSKLTADDANSRIAELEKSIAGADFTGLALDALDANFFKPALDAIEKQFADQPLVKAKLLQSIATTERELGLLDSAESPQRKAVEIRRQLLGDGHPDTLTSIKDLGYLLWSHAKYAEAEGYTRQALDLRRRVLGEDHIDTLDSLDKYGILLRDEGKLQEAETHARDALERRRRVLGDDHPDTISSLANVATLYKIQGRLAEAEPFDREALERYRKVLGDEHPHTLVAINNMGVMMQSLGKLPEAESYYRQAIDVSTRVLGHDHPDTLAYISNLAALLKDRGKLEEAEKFSRDAVESRRRLLGNDHPHTLMSISNLGTLLRDSGKFVEAEAVTREAFEKRRQILGPEHTDTLTSMGNLSYLLQSMGRLEEAEAMVREALAIRRRVLGNDHPLTLNSINNLGALLKEAGKFDEAETFSREALEIRRRKLGDDHNQTIISILNLAILLKSENKLSEAESLSSEALERCRRVLGNEHPVTLSAIGNMGTVLQAQGHSQEAIEILTPALPTARKVFIQGEALRLTRFLLALGRAHAAAADFKNAEVELTEAKTIIGSAKNATERDRKDLASALTELYDAWNTAEPDKGHDADAAKWRGNLNNWQASTQPAPTE
jgi:serine/threonine protein kinase/tetratricopeptide (TPR) repeat protein